MGYVLHLYTPVLYTCELWVQCCKAVPCARAGPHLDLRETGRRERHTLLELTNFVGAVPGLYFRSNEDDDYMNVNWDDVYDSYSGLSDDLNEMNDDDKKEYLLKNADQDELNDIYWNETITIWNEEKLLDFIVFSRKLVNS